MYHTTKQRGERNEKQLYNYVTKNYDNIKSKLIFKWQLKLYIYNILNLPIAIHLIDKYWFADKNGFFEGDGFLR